MCMGDAFSVPFILSWLRWMEVNIFESEDWDFSSQSPPGQWPRHDGSMCVNGAFLSRGRCRSYKTGSFFGVDTENYGIWCVHSLKWSSPRIIAPPISPSVHLHQFTGYFKGVECTQKDSVILTTYTHQTESSHSLIGSPFLSKWVSMVKLRSWSWADWKFVTLRVGRPSALNTVTEYPDDGVILTSRCVTLIAIFQKSKA